MFKKIAFAALAVTVAASTAFASSAMDNDTIIAATESTYPPYESRNEKGELVGFDIDLVEAVAAKLGKKVEWKDMPFDSLIPALMTGKVDIVAAGVSETPARAKRVNFSDPYEVSYNAFITKSDSDISDAEALKGKAVAVQIGTIQETYVRTLSDVEVKTFQKFDDCVREVIFGRVAATLMDVPVAREFISAKDFAGRVKMAFEMKIEGADKAMAMSKKDPRFTEAVDGALKEMIESGELEEMRAKWF